MIEHIFSGLKSIRRHRRMTVIEAASIIGMWPTSYARLEKGTRRPYFDHARALANALGVTTEDLVTYHDEDTAYRLCLKRDTDRGTPWVNPAKAQLAAANSFAPPPPPTAAENIGTVVFAGADDPELEQLRAQLAAWDADDVVTE